ncbi:nitrous oxide reductase accessory protein NosL [Cytophagaceae bacterium ABcell3]|nr:nitrous oxide reductase accessory protein NosL [Cytophagaceae bacterium ABcell3]
MATLTSYKKGAVYFLSLFIGFVCMSCTTEPQPINYGFDSCEHCKMIISDARYGTEAVSSKGKIYKFDSIECLGSWVNETEDSKQMAMLLVTSFDNPETLIEIDQATFLHSEGLPSPMGLFLTAFSDSEMAEQYQSELGGNIVDWNEVRKISTKLW